VADLQDGPSPKLMNATTGRERVLLATMTREPFQPVRLYYSAPAPPSLARKFRGLACMVEEKARCWQWLFHAEAAALELAARYDGVPVEKRPIVLGRVRFPKSGGMVLETNSIDRAVQGARFFAALLGPSVVAMRCRVINRCFAADEGAPDDLMKALDQDVTVIDPRGAEAQCAQDFKGVRSMAAAERVASESLERRLKSGQDVPLVEDFPLAPEEETPDFQHLATGLNFRFIRAVEHWRGNTHLTLTAIIVRTVQESMRAPGGDVSL